MKKKVFSLMMTLLLAFIGVAKADVVEIGTGTQTTYLYPVNSLYKYSFTEMIYTSAEIGTAGTINSIAFHFNGNAELSRDVVVFMKNVSRSSFSSSTDYESLTSSNIVFTGTLSSAATDNWVTLTLATPFEYDGTSNLMIAFDDNTGSWSSRYFYYTTATNACLCYYNDTYDPNPTNLGGYSGSTTTSSNRPNLRLDITASGGGGAGAGEQIFAMQDEQIVDIVYVGARPNGCWMEPFTFQLINTGAATTITNIDWTPLDYFTLVAPELPVAIGSNDTIDVQLTTGESDNTDWQMVALYGNTRLAAIWNVKVEPYDPICPDVVEEAYDIDEEENQGNPLQPGFSTQLNAHQIHMANGGDGELHNDYTLPFPEIEDGYDAVYKFSVENDAMLTAIMDSTAYQGKVALYRQEGEEFPHPMAGNNYTGISLGMNTAANTTASFTAQIGEGTSTTGYFPFYTLYNYSIAENLYLASELQEAGVTRAPMTSLSWYATNEPGYAQQGITIWMANVEDAALTSTSHPVTGMTKVYTGSMTPAIGWNEFVFNEDSFAWDGHSNILILCQRNNGSWNSTVNWQATSTLPFICMSYNYQDSGAYDATVANTMYASTTRPNIIMKGRESGDRADRQLVTIGGGSTPQVAIPCNFIWAYGENQMILTADEIGTSGNITSIAYKRHSEGSGSPETRNIDVYMKHVTVDSYSSAADWIPVSASDLVFSGNHAFQTTGNDYQAIELSTPFAYNGTDNLLICINDKTGTTGTRQYWTTHSTPVIRSIRAYGSTSVFDPTQSGTPVGGSSLTGTWVADIQLEISQGGSGSGNEGYEALNISAGPEITNLPLIPGTYYLVSSALTSDDDHLVNFAIDPMPCPAIDAEGFALNPSPADDDTVGVQPSNVTLRWMVPAYTTRWRIILGSTYWPELDHPYTQYYPQDEDGNWTWSTTIANSWNVPEDLFNNTNYFWRVEFANDGCVDGVSSPVFGFTTHLNVPQDLVVEDETVFEEDTIRLSWRAVVDRTYRRYYIYRNYGPVSNSADVFEKIGETTEHDINATSFEDGPLSYNMNGYTYYVTAVYDEGESHPSNTVNVKVSGKGFVNGHVFEQDGVVGIAGATVHMVGNDEFGGSHTYDFITDENGYYEGTVYATTPNDGDNSNGYNGSASCLGYQPIDHPVQGNPIEIVYNQTTTPIDYMLDENFYGPCGVVAQFYPD